MRGCVCAGDIELLQAALPSSMPADLREVGRSGELEDGSGAAAKLPAVVAAVELRELLHATPLPPICARWGGWRAQIEERLGVP
ncbi:hypothetical protein OsI_37954 [Oryza sativa Indica Group]|uniref:Uncharacterized protein n=1 Tax=Oryza sativa subsp. indica TaxID=39946 RepID=B8BP29_ORYSI|nr:hypothetical protein OsI_37954 [Oryza sativa Indica Group]